MWNTLSRFMAPIPPAQVVAVPWEEFAIPPAAVGDNHMEGATVSCDLLPSFPPASVARHTPAFSLLAVRGAFDGAIGPASVITIPLTQLLPGFSGPLGRGRGVEIAPPTVAPALPSASEDADATEGTEPRCRPAAKPEPTLEDFLDPLDEEDLIDTAPPVVTAGDALPPLRDFLIDELADELAHFQGLKSLKVIFWQHLGYRRVARVLPAAMFSAGIAPVIQEVTILGEHEGFPVLTVQLRSGGFTRSHRGAVLRRFASLYSAVVVVLGDFSWRRVSLHFVDEEEESSQCAAIRLAPTMHDMDALARRLARLRAYRADDTSRRPLAIIESIRRLFALPTPEEDDHTEERPLTPAQLFYRDLGNQPVLTRDETRRLLQTIAEIGLEDRLGRRRAEYLQCRNRLLLGHMRLCLYIIKRLGLRVGRRMQSLEQTDLVQEGIFGLVRAIEQFDLRQGTEFSTYAVIWMRQRMERAVECKDRLIRIPVHLLRRNGSLSLDKLRRLTWVRSLSANEYGICHELVDHRHGNPSASAADRDAGSHRRRLLDKALQSLAARDREILLLRFGLKDGTEYTLEEVGQMFQLTKERIRQIQEKALGKLRHPQWSQLLSQASGHP